MFNGGDNFSREPNLELISKWRCLLVLASNGLQNLFAMKVSINNSETASFSIQHNRIIVK
jgi:hypothetical protein